MNAALASNSPDISAFKHHADPRGLIHTRKVSLARGAFMHHAEQGHLNHYAAFQGLTEVLSPAPFAITGWEAVIC